MRKKRACVFGSYKSLNQTEKERIVKLGGLLAAKGFEVMSGGFGGTMEDISRGAKLAGGKTIGVTYYKYIDARDKKPNKFIDEEIRAKNIFERINIMTEKADAFIVLPGGTGTLLELAACLELMNKGLTEPKPIIAFGDFWSSVLDKLSGEPVLSEKTRSAFNALSCSDLVTFVKSPEEAIDKIETFLK